VTSVQDFMNSVGGHPPVKLGSPGDKLVFDLLGVRLVQERDYDTEQPVFEDDGRPRMQLVLDMRIDWAASSGNITTGKDGNQEETGSLYCKRALTFALKQACQDAGCSLEEVGRGAILRLEDGVPRNPRNKPPHQFTAQVKKAANAAVTDLLNQAGPDTPAQQPQPQGVPTGSLI
jgi:hypothetical protein